MSFRGFAIRVLIPHESLGRLRVPSWRFRMKDGWLRFGQHLRSQDIVVTLEDREGHEIRVKSMIEVRAVARRVGFAACIALMKHNTYEPGEHPGDARQIRIAAA